MRLLVIDESFLLLPMLQDCHIRMHENNQAIVNVVANFRIAAPHG